MKARAVSYVLSAGFISTALIFANAQDAPIPKPKSKPTSAATTSESKPRSQAPRSTILLICDLACNWEVDGETKGRVQDGGSAKARVELGEHIIKATTVDGLDSAEVDRSFTEAGQSIVRVDLKSARDARLAADDKKKGDRLGYWQDPATGLKWTKKDIGYDVGFLEAEKYCLELQLGDMAWWRLPTIDELRGLYDGQLNSNGYHVKGNLQITGWEWSNSDDDSHWTFSLADGKQLSFSGSYDRRALCVHR